MKCISITYFSYLYFNYYTTLIFAGVPLGGGVKRHSTLCKKYAKMTATVILYIGFLLYNCLEKTTQTGWKTWKTQGISFCQICKHPVILFIAFILICRKCRWVYLCVLQIISLTMCVGWMCFCAFQPYQVVPCCLLGDLSRHLFYWTFLRLLSKSAPVCHFDLSAKIRTRARAFNSLLCNDALKLSLLLL